MSRLLLRLLRLRQIDCRQFDYCRRLLFVLFDLEYKEKTVYHCRRLYQCLDRGLFLLLRRMFLRRRLPWHHCL